MSRFHKILHWYSDVARNGAGGSLCHLLNQEENIKPSFHEKIRIARVREYDFEQVCRDIDELVAVARHFDDMATVRKMKEMVPEYKSNNSVYEALDRK